MWKFNMSDFPQNLFMLIKAYIMFLLSINNVDTFHSLIRQPCQYSSKAFLGKLPLSRKYWDPRQSNLAFFPFPLLLLSFCSCLNLSRWYHHYAKLLLSSYSLSCWAQCRSQLCGRSHLHWSCSEYCRECHSCGIHKHIKCRCW